MKPKPRGLFWAVCAGMVAVCIGRAASGQTTIIYDNFDPLSAGANVTAGYMFGDTTSSSSSVVSGVGLGGSAGWQTVDTAGSGSAGYSGVGAQYQNEAIITATDTNLSDYTLSFYARATSTGGAAPNLTIIIQTWPGESFSGTMTGSLIAGYNGIGTVLLSTNYTYYSLNLGNSNIFQTLQGGFTPAGGTYQITMQINGGGAPPYTDTLDIDNLSLTSAPPQVQGILTTNWNALVNNWVETSAPTNEAWWAIASSADGTKLVAGAQGDVYGNPTPMYISGDSGKTWAPASTPAEFWGGFVCSADGTRLAAAAWGGPIFTSSNAGATWTQTSAPNGPNWETIASSADGTKLVAGAYFDWASPGYYASTGGGIYTSTNAGVTWTQMNSWTTNDGWDCIVCSSDGSKLAAGCTFYRTVLSGGVYTSTNGGVTWSLQSGSTNLVPWGLSSSADASKLGVVDLTDPVFTSTNSGVNWSQTSLPTAAWTGITSSTDASKLAAVATYEPPYTSGIWTSTNAGSTWTQSSAPTNANALWECIASSADGTKLAAGELGGGIWIAQATIQVSAPGLTIGLSDNSVMVSWPTNGNYTLQQNSNLAAPGGWTKSGYSVSTANGTNSVRVTPAAGSLFFRLVQP